MKAVNMSSDAFYVEQYAMVQRFWKRNKGFSVGMQKYFEICVSHYVLF